MQLDSNIVDLKRYYAGGNGHAIGSFSSEFERRYFCQIDENVKSRSSRRNLSTASSLVWLERQLRQDAVSGVLDFPLSLTKASRQPPVDTATWF